MRSLALLLSKNKLSENKLIQLFYCCFIYPTQFTYLLTVQSQQQYMYTRISGRYAPFILGPAGGGPGVGALPLFWGSTPVLIICPKFKHVNNKKIYKISEISDIFFFTFSDFFVARIGAKTQNRGGAPKEGRRPYPRTAACRA